MERFEKREKLLAFEIMASIMKEFFIESQCFYLASLARDLEEEIRKER